jgi:hypothetical protein
MFIILSILYFMFKQRNGLLLGLGFSVPAVVKNHFYLATHPLPAARKVQPDPDATYLRETGRLRRPPPRSGQNPTSSTGKPVRSTKLLAGNTGLPVPAADNRAPMTAVGSGRHFGKPVHASDFSPSLLDLPVFSVDKLICCVYRPLLLISSHDFWVPYT